MRFVRSTVDAAPPRWRVCLDDAQGRRAQGAQGAALSSDPKPKTGVGDLVANPCTYLVRTLLF